MTALPLDSFTWQHRSGLEHMRRRSPNAGSFALDSCLMCTIVGWLKSGGDDLKHRAATPRFAGGGSLVSEQLDRVFSSLEAGNHTPVLNEAGSAAGGCSLAPEAACDAVDAQQ